MAKMTPARVERWQRDLVKARDLLAAIDRDLLDAKLNSTGAVYSNVIDARGLISIALGNLRGLTEESRDRSPIARIRQLVKDRSRAK